MKPLPDKTPAHIIYLLKIYYKNNNLYPLYPPNGEVTPLCKTKSVSAEFLTHLYKGWGVFENSGYSGYSGYKRVKPQFTPTFSVPDWLKRPVTDR